MEHLDTLISMNNLALVLSDQGKLEDGERMFREVLAIGQRNLGKEHSETMTRGKYEEVEEMHREELAIRQRVLAVEHPDTVTSMTSLAWVLRD